MSTSIDRDDVFNDHPERDDFVEIAAAARALHLGLLSAPVPFPCALCSEAVFDDEKVGLFCYPCSRVGWDRKMPKRLILQFAGDLAALTGAIPAQGFPGMDAISVFDADTQVKIVTLGKRAPTVDRVRAAYGSWLAVLIKSGVLPEGTQRLPRGTRCIAKDGHICHSLPEKAICDFFADEGIEHTREPRYPGTNLRADFQVGETFIEYFGLTGTPAYDAKSKQKREIAQLNGINLVELFPQDMLVWPATRQRLIELLAESGN